MPPRWVQNVGKKLVCEGLALSLEGEPALAKTEQALVRSARSESLVQGDVNDPGEPPVRHPA